eukprot:scaffold212_cov404-Prasinococcus_capsulatus_cf.AAC.19
MQWTDEPIQEVLRYDRRRLRVVERGCPSRETKKPCLGGVHVGVAGGPFNSTWVRSSRAVTLRCNSVAIEWLEPEHPEVIYTSFPARTLGVGDRVLFVLEWESDGRNDCDSEAWESQAYCKVCCLKGVVVLASLARLGN